MDKLKFDPEDGFLNSASYPDPQNETEGREQLFTLHRQSRDFINLTIDKLINSASLEMNGTESTGTLKNHDGSAALTIAEQISSLDKNRVISHDLRFIGVTSDGNFKKSNDGIKWEELILSSQIMDETNRLFPKRKKIKFINCEITDSEEMIVIKASGTGGGGAIISGHYINNIKIQKTDFNVDVKGDVYARVRIAGLKETDFACAVFNSEVVSKYQGRCFTELGYLKVTLNKIPDETVVIDTLLIEYTSPWPIK